jgi:hypothetical protein
LALKMGENRVFWSVLLQQSMLVRLGKVDAQAASACALVAYGSAISAADSRNSTMEDDEIAALEGIHAGKKHRHSASDLCDSRRFLDFWAKAHVHPYLTFGEVRVEAQNVHKTPANTV